jgi:hypothetical protein
MFAAATGTILDVDRIVGMLSPIDDVHHGHRQDACRSSADIAKERLTGGLGRCFGNGQRHSEYGVCAKATFVFGAVEFAHGHVNGHLFGSVKADDGLGDLCVDRRHCL